MSEQETQSEMVYCPQCETKREVIGTVPWQEDMCSECRNAIPTES